MLIIQSNLYQKLSNLIKNGPIISTIVNFGRHFWSNSMIFDINSNITSNLDIDFEYRIEYRHGFQINIVATIYRHT